MTTVTIWSAVHNRPLKPMQWPIFDRLKDAAYPPAIVQLKAEGALEENCGHRPVQYLNNVLEQDHRAIKRRVRASQHFRSFWGAWRTIAGYEAIHMIRKGQAW
jgi:IS6 family transposase